MAQPAHEISRLIPKTIGCPDRLQLLRVALVLRNIENAVYYRRQFGSGSRGQAPLPFESLGFGGMVDASNGLFQLLDAGADLLAPPLLLGRGQFQTWLIGIVEEGKQLIIFALTYGIELVVVALGT